MELSPAARSIRARMAAHISWANTADPSARTAPARSEFLERFERQVDPEGVLPEDERIRRAEHARRAHMQRMAFLSAKARQAKAAQKVSDDA